MPATEPLVFIDLETTGTRSTRDRITEIAALKVVDGREVARWSSLIYPECRVPAAIAELTGITDTLLAEAPRFGDIASALQEWLGEARLVAHNARFDHSFLRNEFKRAGIAYRAEVICTLRLSRRLAPQQPEHNLGALLKQHGIPHALRHRAEADAQALWKLWQHWHATLPDDTLASLLETERKNRSLPVHLKPDLLNDIPSLPGVYLLYGHNRLPLYVGKSVNLRSRVLGHFQRDHQDDKEMRLAQQVQHIEWEEASGDLGAQLREAHLIKELMPIMNRQLRRQGNLYSWYWPDKSPQPQLSNETQLNQVSGPVLYGLFRSARKARAALKQIVDEERLCPQVIGLEKGRGRCFANQLGKCCGACTGVESLPQHSRRAREAMARLQLQAWPWQGRIAIGEHHPASKTGGWHVVEHWRYLGSALTLEAARRLQVATPQFDVDSYRILNRFLRDSQQHQLDVVELA
ncbi:DNA polymerase III subunit epsilon [Halomonas sp. ZH2S]|uniref:DNA-directed DNA polymerase n=1 Tax=Vreelandella zhuhanensis TaxID=2684210 RepID=A0A7X3H138_9GAMM|nr:3'-5' exonuclease family protein [Halomonas zhuhanensis]MWJ28592.1 DNA polymerase III subunit epsilon [Halomonas zhuhanensis]